MAEAENAIFSILTSDVGVAARVVQSSGKWRVYPYRTPHIHGMPYITYERIDTEPVNHLNGFAGAFMASFKIDIVDDDPDSTATLAKLVRDAMDITTTSSHGGVTVQGIQWIAEDRSAELYGDGGDTNVTTSPAIDKQVFTISQIYEVWVSD